MKAIMTHQNEDGSYDEVGMNNRRVIGPYKTEQNLIRFGTPKDFNKRTIRIEIFYSDSILIGNPNKTIFINP